MVSLVINITFVDKKYILSFLYSVTGDFFFSISVLIGVASFMVYMDSSIRCIFNLVQLYNPVYNLL